MAQMVNKQKLANEEVDSLVAQQLVGFITRISKEFNASEIQVNLLKKKGAEISAREVIDSIKRLITSDSLQIKMSNVLFLPSRGGVSYRFRVACNVELAHKTQKEA